MAFSMVHMCSHEYQLIVQQQDQVIRADICSGTAMRREAFRALTALATLTNAAGDAITAEGSDEWQTTTASLYFTACF